MKIASGIAACALAYVCAYLLLLMPDTFWFCSLGCTGTPYRRVAEFRAGGETLKKIFAPLTWVDRTLRPTYWSGIKLFDGTSVRTGDPRAWGLVPGGGFSGAPPSESFPDPAPAVKK
jgi:hypothetical protein